jgi:G3E family GTPase
MSAAVIPVSLLTGFLGSDKTTMLRHLVRQPDFSRTAVIINEFGEVGLGECRSVPATLRNGP